MGQQSKTEEKLNDIFVKNAPFQIPENGRKAIVRYLPWISLVLAVLVLLSVYFLWDWAHTTSKLINYANELSRVYGGTAAVSTSRLTTTVWIGIAVLAVEGILYLISYPGLKARKKQGWNMLFYLAILNVVYGVVITFTDYGSIGNLIGTLIGSVIGLYVLFQIRGYYTVHSHQDASSHHAKAHTK